jgi:hypothetical protein
MTCSFRFLDNRHLPPRARSLLRARDNDDETQGTWLQHY